MAIEGKKTPYEVLVRLDESGVRGAHVQDLIQLFDTETGEKVGEQIGDARPVTVEEVGAILGEQNASLIEQAAARDARIAELEQARAELDAALAVEKAAREAAESKLAQIAGLAGING